MPSPSWRPSHGTGRRPLLTSPPPTTAQRSTDSRKTRETAMEMRCDASPSPSGGSRVPAPGDPCKTTCSASSAPRSRTVAPQKFSLQSGWWRSSSGSSQASVQRIGNWSMPSPRSPKSAGALPTISGGPCERSTASASLRPHHTKGNWWRWRRSASLSACRRRRPSPLTMMDPPSGGKGRKGATAPARRCQTRGQPCGHGASGTSVHAMATTPSTQHGTTHDRGCIRLSKTSATARTRAARYSARMAGDATGARSSAAWALPRTHSCTGGVRQRRGCSAFTPTPRTRGSSFVGGRLLSPRNKKGQLAGRSRRELRTKSGCRGCGPTSPGRNQPRPAQRTRVLHDPTSPLRKKRVRLASRATAGAHRAEAAD